MRANRAPLKRRIRPSVPVDLEVDGEKHTFDLAFDFNALARIEEKTDLKTINILAIWRNLGSARVLGAVFWAATLLYQPEYDSEEGYRVLQSLLGPENWDPISGKLWDAYMLFLPPDQRKVMTDLRQKAEADPTTPPDAKAATAGSATGSDSGQSPDTTLGSA